MISAVLFISTFLSALYLENMTFQIFALVMILFLLVHQKIQLSKSSLIKFMLTISVSTVIIALWNQISSYQILSSFSLYFIASLTIGFLLLHKKYELPQENSNSLQHEVQKQKRETSPRPSKSTSLFLILTILLGAGAYLYKIGNYGFQGDEYYVVQESETFFESGKLFYIGESPSGRSKISTLLAIGSKKIFNSLGFSEYLGDEFIYRFPFAIASILSIFLIFKIAKFYVSDGPAVMITLLFTTEIWFIYFARYTRFYSLVLLLALLLIYIIHKFQFRKVVIFLCILISLLGFKTLQAYCMFLAVFFSIIFVLKYYEEKKYKHLLAMIVLGILFFIGAYIHHSLKFGGDVYNSTVWNFNAQNIKRQIHWLFLNYGFVMTLFTGSFVLLFPLKNTLQKSLLIYGWTSLFFFLFYVNNVPFNFTFRPIYFFLPVIFIIAIQVLYIILKERKYVFYTIVSLLLIKNGFALAQHSIHNPGDHYYPTKLVFEKHHMIYGNKDIALFLEEYIQKNNIEEYQIISIGLGSIAMYSDLPVYKSYTWAYNDHQEFRNMIQTTDIPIFIVNHATAKCNSENYVYKAIYNRDCVTEVSPRYHQYLEETHKFFSIYTSQDSISQVYSNIATM